MNCSGYPVELRPANEDAAAGWIAFVPEFPQVRAYGPTPREALIQLDKETARVYQIPLFNPALNVPLRY